MAEPNDFRRVPTLTVRSLRARAVRVPMRRPLATRVGSFDHWLFVLIDLETDQGETGRSYLSSYRAAAAKPLILLLEDLARQYAGRPLAPFDLYQESRTAGAVIGHQGLAAMAWSGLDMALWDAHARAAGLPLARLFGGSLEPVRAYNSNGLGLMPAGQVGAEAVELVEEGSFTAVKVRLGRPTLAEDLAALRAVRDALGDDVTLFCDFNQGLSPGEAMARCRAIDGEGLAWIEEPVAYGDLAGSARLARALATPVQLGENFYGVHAMAEALAAEACDLVMPDLGRIGGVSGWLRAAGLADAWRIPMSSHLYPEISSHLLRVTPTAHWLEWSDWASPILEQPCRVEAGRVVVPERPGNGLAWNEEAVARYALTS